LIGQATVRLADELVDADDPLRDELTAWLAESRRFRAFAAIHRAKIRKKLRSVGDGESRMDVRAELQVARLLLMDRRVEIAFEGYGSTSGGPDFTIGIGGARMNLEVTRLRGAADPEQVAGRLLVKLRQLPPSVPNAVLLATAQRAPDLDAAVGALMSRSDAYVAARGFPNARALRQRMSRLGAVIAWSEAPRAATAWVNPTARLPVPPRALKACLSCLG
jgi:hypothetical protein